MSEGLPHNFVDDIYKDSQGFLWISMGGGGLSRYDGYSFVDFNLDSPQYKLKSNFVHNVVEDSFQRLWVASEGGLDILDLTTLQPSALLDSRSEAHVFSQKSISMVILDAAGCIWMHCNDCLYRIAFTPDGQIRQVNSEIPIIFLTAKNLKEDIFDGFKIGADDYITKPFSMEELVFRMEAILRRVRGKKVKETNMYKLGKFTFDTQRQILAIGDKQTKLTTKESELLSLLCAHANDVLQRELALKTIWIDDNYFNARSMDVYITKLRKHLKDDPEIEINNVHGKGYRLIVPNDED